MMFRQKKPSSFLGETRKWPKARVEGFSAASHFTAWLSAVLMSEVRHDWLFQRSRSSYRRWANAGMTFDDVGNAAAGVRQIHVGASLYYAAASAVDHRR